MRSARAVALAVEPREREIFRLSMITNHPVFLLLNVDGEDVDPVVNELGGGGARLLCKKHFDSFYEGQTLNPSILLLDGVGMPVVQPVVRWKSWPIVGVEFMDIGDKEREAIFKFLFSVERKRIPYQAAV